VFFLIHGFNVTGWIADDLHNSHAHGNHKDHPDCEDKPIRLNKLHSDKAGEKHDDADRGQS
jgi:hypothetical protein